MPVDIEIFKDIPFFRDLNEEELKQISLITELVSYPENKTVFRQGDEGEALYVILEGKTELRKNFKNKEQKITTISKGYIVGEMSFLTESRRSATLKTLTYVKALKISKKQFKKLLHEEQSLAAYKIIYRMAQILSFRLTRMSEQFVEIMNKQGKPEAEQPGIIKYIKRFMFHG